MNANALEKLIVAFVLVIFVQKTHGIDTGMGGDIEIRNNIALTVGGDIGVAYDFINNKLETQYNIGVLGCMVRNLNIGFNVSILRLIDKYAYDRQSYMEYSFLPLEIYYRPLKFGKMFYVTIYGKGEWQFRNNNPNEGVDPVRSG